MKKYLNFRNDYVTHNVCSSEKAQVSKRSKKSARIAIKNQFRSAGLAKEVLGEREKQRKCLKKKHCLKLLTEIK